MVMTNLATADGPVLCLVQLALSVVLLWQVFNLQFESFRTAPKPLRLAASGLMFAVLSGICIALTGPQQPGADWPHLLILASLSCLVQRMRQARTCF